MKQTSSKEYQKEWRKQHPNYDTLHSRKFRKENQDYDREMYKKRKKENPDKIRNYHKIYMKDYLKKPEEVKKQKIRQKTRKIYGEVANGYHRHHINYDSPHNFILIPITEHKRIHRRF